MRKNLSGIALALALAMGVQGCYGSFTLTRKLWAWNGTLGHGVDEAVFLVTGVILPVYGIAALVDAIALNSVEFWTGKNPMMSKVITSGDKRLVLKGDPATGLVHVMAYENNKFTGEMYLEKTATGIEAVTPDKSKVLYFAKVISDDNAVLADASGALVAHPAVQ